MATNKNCQRFVLFMFLTVLIVVASPQKALAQPYKEAIIHVVAWGETVSSIAARYGVAISDIVSTNQLTEADAIFVGQRLVIPVIGSLPAENNWSKVHTVQYGETLYRISLKYGVSVQAIMGANALLDANQICAGQTLIIPQGEVGTSFENGDLSGAGVVSTHIVKSSETLSGISQYYGVSMNALQTANGLFNPSLIFVGQRLVIPGAANASNPGYTPAQVTITHVVQPGENLSTIAAHYGVSMWVIAQSNHINNTSLIYPGQVLSIPSSTALSSLDVPVGEPGRSVIVDVSEQRAYVYENGMLLQVFVVSTGLPGQETRRGSFQIQNKIPVAYAATWDLQMPHWLGFYWSGPLQNGFHALPILSNGVRLWEGLLGSPASYGCVILSDVDARWLYEWASIGMPVTVRD